MPEAARVFRGGDAFAEVAQEEPVRVRAELAQIARRIAVEFDPPDRRRGHGAPLSASRTVRLPALRGSRVAPGGRAGVVRGNDPQDPQYGAGSPHARKSFWCGRSCWRVQRAVVRSQVEGARPALAISAMSRVALMRR